MAKPIILVLGATGQLGSLISEQLAQTTSVNLRVCAREQNKLEQLRSKYGSAVFLDLDKPETFASALEGVQAAFLLTGYTFKMVTQSKTFVDAARKAGLKHLVHLGVFTPEWDCTDPHFSWHQLVETYIKHSGVAWTFLHPNIFMQNLCGFFSMIKYHKFIWYAGNAKTGWVALEDVAEAAARVLVEGATLHSGKEYWFSTESLTATEIAATISGVIDSPITTDLRPPSCFLADIGLSEKEADPYMLGAQEFFAQVIDGRMSYIADIRDDMPLVCNRPGLTMKQWASEHREELLKAADSN